MATVLYVAAHVGQVHQQRRRLRRFFRVADLCGDDR
jgi:hypothetical protein